MLSSSVQPAARKTNLLLLCWLELVLVLVLALLEPAAKSHLVMMMMVASGHTVATAIGLLLLLQLSPVHTTYKGTSP